MAFREIPNATESATRRAIADRTWSAVTAEAVFRPSDVIAPFMIEVEDATEFRPTLFDPMLTRGASIVVAVASATTNPETTTHVC